MRAAARRLLLVGSVVLPCALTLAVAAGAGERVSVAYKRGFLVDTVSGEIVSRRDGVLVLGRWKEGEREDLRIPFGDLREIDGDPAMIVIGRWRTESAGVGPEGGDAEEPATGERITMVYRETFVVKTISAELLDRGGEFVKVRVVSGGRKRLLSIPRTSVKSINDEPAGRVFAQWDKMFGRERGEAASSLPAGPPVSLSYKDGFVVSELSGLLVSRDMRKVVVRATVEGVVRDIALLWKDIREYDGRPADEEMRRFRQENKDRLCPDCKAGTVVKRCDKCSGTGWISDEWEPCRNCGATGYVPCSAAGCTKGYFECPGPCLKRSRGRWTKNWDGKYWIKFGYGRNKYVAFSEDKVGQVVKRVDGVPRIIGPCPLCGGKGRIPCKACNGTGRHLCPKCKGMKKVPSHTNAEKCPHCEGGIVPCKKCGGTGLLPEKDKEKAKGSGKK